MFRSLPTGLPAQSHWKNLVGLIRASTWWEHKLACLLGTAYALAWAHRLPAVVLGPLLLQIVAAFVPCAAYVCLINDLTDRDEDRRAGKPNQMTARSPAFRAGAVGLCLLAGLIAGGWFFHNCPLTLSAYAANWLAFTLYSVPPFRLKTKGVWGVLADTCGGQFLPTLWVAAFIAEAAGYRLELGIALPLGLWAFALGLRGILSHQLADFENDQRAGVKTLVVRLGAAPIRQLVGWVIFPLEVLALLGVLLRLFTPFTAPLLVLYLLLEVRRAKAARRFPSWRNPEPERWSAPAEYHKFYYPMTFVLALSMFDPRALVFAVAQVLLFPQCSRRFAQDLLTLFRAIGRRAARLRLGKTGHEG